MIGKKLSPILVEIEETLWEFEANVGIQPEYTIDGFRAATKIFMSVMLDKMYNLQIYENLSDEDKLNMAQKCGEDLKKFIKTYTNIYVPDLYKKDKS